MEYLAPLCIDCVNFTNKISAKYIGGPLGACLVRKKVPRDVYYKGRYCKKFVLAPGIERVSEFTDGTTLNEELQIRKKII